LNEVWEIIRIVIYPLGAVGLLFLGHIHKESKIALHSMATYFLMWAFLLTEQIQHTTEYYRQLSNWVSTPMLIGVVFLVFLNLYKSRKL